GRIYFGEKADTISTFGLSADSALLRDRLIAGDGFQTPRDRSVVLNEFLLYRWGIIEEPDLAAVVGKQVRLDGHVWGMRRPNLLLRLLGGAGANADAGQEAILEKAAQQLPAALDKMDFSPAERSALRQLLTTPRPPPAFRPDQTVSVEL